MRYYERARLLRPAGRTVGNYRVYGAAALERLRFIRAAQTGGFTLEDIRSLLNFRDGKTAPCKEVQVLIQQRLADVVKRVDEMRHVRAVLQSSLRMCRRAERTGTCCVIETLKVAASPAASKPLRRTPLK